MLNPKAQPRAMAVGRHPIVAALQLVGMVEEVSPEGCIRGRCCRRCCHFQCHSIGPSQSLLLWLVILRAIALPEAIQRLTQVPVAAAATKHASLAGKREWSWATLAMSRFVLVEFGRNASVPNSVTCCVVAGRL